MSPALTAANETPLYPKRKLAINDAYDRLERELFGRWALFNSGKPLTLTDCQGKEFSLGGGVEFDGSPRVIFWDFFEPCFRKVITEQIDHTIDECRDHPDLVEAALGETAELLENFVCRAYERMADIDQRLRGKGYPSSVERRPVKGRISAMCTVIDVHIDAAKRLASMQRWGNILIEPEAKNLLITLAEAARNVPQDKRESFRLLDVQGGEYLEHPGLPGASVKTHLSDARMLEREGLVDHRQGSSPLIWLVDVTSKGFAYYRHLKGEMGKPAERLEGEMRDYISSHQFRQRYNEAYRKWSEAERLLWSADSGQHLTAIGHHCREALQEFTNLLVEQHNPLDVESDKARTKNRLRAVIKLHSENLGERENTFLAALVSYWESVVDLCQRQEHGVQKEGKPLVFEDARRVVFHTLVVMYEIGRALQRISPDRFRVNP